MKRDSTARVLTIIGTIINCVIVAIAFSWHIWGLVTAFIGLIPLELFMLSLGVAVGFLLFGVIFGLILPFWGYRRIRPDDKATAGALLIVSGVFSLFISVVGGILLLIGGILTTYWDPHTET